MNFLFIWIVMFALQKVYYPWIIFIFPFWKMSSHKKRNFILIKTRKTFEPSCTIKSSMKGVKKSWFTSFIWNFLRTVQELFYFFIFMSFVMSYWGMRYFHLELIAIWIYSRAWPLVPSSSLFFLLYPLFEASSKLFISNNWRTLKIE